MAAVTLPPPLELTVTHNTSTPHLEAVEKEVRMHVTTGVLAKLVMDYFTPSLFSRPAGTTLGSSSMFRFGETPVEINLCKGNHRLSEFAVYAMREASVSWDFVDYRNLSRREAFICDFDPPSNCAGYGNIFYKIMGQNTCIISDIGGAVTRLLHNVPLPSNQMGFQVVSAEEDNRQLIAATKKGEILRVSEKGICTLFETNFGNVLSLRQIASDTIVIAGTWGHWTSDDVPRFRALMGIEMWNPSELNPTTQVVITDEDAGSVNAQIVSDGIVVLQRNSSLFVPFSDITHSQPLASMQLDPATTRIFDDFFVVDDRHLFSTDPHFPFRISLQYPAVTTWDDLCGRIHYGHGSQLIVSTSTGSMGTSGPLYSFNFHQAPTKK